MARTNGSIRVLKQAPKARGANYAEVSRSIGMSEASVKRVSSHEDFVLERSDEIADLARGAAARKHAIARLTLEQACEIERDRNPLLPAVCALNHRDYDQILARPAHRR